MKNKISAIIIDPNKDQHNYTGIKTSYNLNKNDQTFDLKVYKNTEN